MNILLTVFAILMMMSIMTYAKLQTFMVAMSLQSQYLCYMKTAMQDEISESQTALYEALHIKRQTRANQSDRSQAVSKINLILFISSKERSTHEAEFLTLKNILVNLIYHLYHKQPFYEEMKQKRESFVEEILDKIMKLSELPQNLGKIKTAADLANLDLEDGELQDAFAKMLLGTNQSIKAIHACQSSIEELNRSEIGYLSLLPFLYIEQKIKPFRIYLIPPELLYAIYGDLGSVEAIMQERQRIYTVLDNTSESDSKTVKDSLREGFQGFLQSKTPPGVDLKLLNADISLTRPHNQWLEPL